MDHIDADDIRALRRQGDLRGYLRSLTRNTTTPTTAQAATTTTADYGPHHTPGAWPHGTHPATATICRPDCGCAPTPPTT